MRYRHEWVALLIYNLVRVGHYAARYPPCKCGRPYHGWTPGSPH